MINHAYSNYAKYAWGANEHRSISKTSHSANIFGSSPLGISIIDSIDTIYLADLKEFYQKSRDWIETKFDPNVASEVSVFEINIRLVGGFLSIYALTNDKLYLDKAELVADRLLPAFDTPTGIPHALITLSNGASKNWNWAGGGCSILSELGTIHLEFQYLSQLTGKDIYLQKVEKIRKVLKDASENHLYYNYISPQTGKWCQKQASLGALGDSFYEYLLKSWILSGKKDEQARSMYEDAMKAAEESMLRKTPTTNLMYFGEQRSGRLDPQMGHLTCFVGGLYVLSALSAALSTNTSTNNQMEIARSIGTTCHEAYIRTATGLGPEAFHFERVDVEAKSLRENEKYYILRPEVIETWFYLWRSTHEQIYRDWAWDAIISLEKYCRVDGGYSGIKDVYSSSVIHDDVQQNTYVFNTEAHPFRIRTSLGRINELIENNVKNFFSLWTISCSEWLNVFTNDAVWYHPNFPDGLQYNQLLDFCQMNQLVKPALFRQDGQIRVTISGNKTSSSNFYHVMVPYVYGQIQNGNNNSLFINSGYEYIQLVLNRKNQLHINMVIEFFNRASLPFAWLPNN
ncbi:unnamed protein product [Rotaria sordida]|uniref:alpha-1,2-Mannosidase n=1 Tax=Rotaria sordida TaxID=392033 RepID=A0A814RD13_9BILA|nr:unnamed protein product [Rotaria sordida]